MERDLGVRSVDLAHASGQVARANRLGQARREPGQQIHRLPHIAVHGGHTDAMKERAFAPRDSHPRATLGLFTSTTTREALWTSMTAGSLSGWICIGGAA